MTKVLQENDPTHLLQSGFKPDLGKLRRECRTKEIKMEVERKSKGRTGWPPDVWATELKKKFVNNSCSDANVNTESKASSNASHGHKIYHNHNAYSVGNGMAKNANKNSYMLTSYSLSNRPPMNQNTYY